ncbi:flagellar motor switch protein FliN [Idiomarina piscisalsi]|jgi:flagellar motor switch protein FliN/FliY|uniref:Flagellar motor switch protein FliN n=1 Tax=Idiomarina piscisalsi TaxID=1096243 RepID=A0A432YF67_9GAMM|nr:flagellar motor switch protein FliN [Idiomarina piscisalsi]RUO59597.1 flagellar motor switch protein FliN [Idiomarina piscisalsi]
MSNDDKDMDDWEAAMAEQAAAEDEESSEGDASESEKPSNASHSGMDNVQTAELEELNEDSPVGEEEKRKLDAILDIPVTISMEVGRSQISIRNLLQLNQGSVVELERVAGEPLDVLVNGTLIAHGEVVVVNDKFGIRLTDVISQIERIRKLR